MSSRRRVVVAAAALPLALTGLPAQAAGNAPAQTPDTLSSAAASAVRVPGNLTGLGFDTCQAPDQATMDTLRTESPYWGVGVYVGGEERSCVQPNLTAAWVSAQAHRGWRIFPIWAGRQSACADAGFDHEISARNARAAEQGVSAANGAIRAATQLGMVTGSTLFLDVESYDNTTSACNQPVLHYQSGWSKRLHRVGYKSGFYAAASSGIASLDYVRATFPDTYEMPDAVWVSHANGKETTDADPYLRDGFWRHQRLRQYAIDQPVTYGDVSLVIDRNAIDIGRGSVAPAESHNCGGVRLSFARYRVLSRGDKDTQVAALQCLLKQRRLFSGTVSQTFNAATTSGVRAFQRAHGLRTTGTSTAPTWTALFAAGSVPLLKRGSASDRVRFLQRALTAALGKSVAVTGTFSRATATATGAYQRAVLLPDNGIANRSTWKALQTGRR